MDENMQTQKHVCNIPHTVPQIPLECFKITRIQQQNKILLLNLSPSNTPNTKASSYRGPHWYAALVEARSITHLPLFISPKERFFPEAFTTQEPLQQVSPKVSPAQSLPATAANPSPSRDYQQKGTAPNCQVCS